MKTVEAYEYEIANLRKLRRLALVLEVVDRAEIHVGRTDEEIRVTFKRETEEGGKVTLVGERGEAQDEFLEEVVAAIEQDLLQLVKLRLRHKGSHFERSSAPDPLPAMSKEIEARGESDR